MSEKIIVPTLGESVAEATVAKWLKNKGDKVSSDEPIVELETDKVNVEVPSPINGILENIAVKEGETVNVGSLLGSIAESKSKSSEKVSEKKYSPPKQEKTEKPIKKEKIVKEFREKKDLKVEEKPLFLEEVKEQKIFNEEPLILENSYTEKFEKVTKVSTDLRVSPSARKIAAEKKLI